MRKAIILSAGQGKRLLPLTESRPKCLLDVAGKSMLEWQARSLAANGIDEAVVVAGFAADTVEAAVAGMHVPNLCLRTLFNPFHGVADNIASCFVAAAEMQGEFLLLNGDTLFEPEVLARLLRQAGGGITVTIDRKAAYDDDDMKVRLDGNRLAAIGKGLPPQSVHAESIGLLAFRGGGGRLFSAEIERQLRMPGGLRLWYLSVIDALAAAHHVRVVSVEGLDWGEVDVPADLERAEILARSWRDGSTAFPQGEDHPVDPRRSPPRQTAFQPPPAEAPGE